MEFPRRTSMFFPLLFAFLFSPFLLAIPGSLWLSWTLNPLQKWYLSSYAASSIGGGLHHRTTIRWLMKTAPGRKSVVALPEDLIPGPDRKLPVSLSPSAIAKGWRGVAITAASKTPSDNLNRVLRESVYDGESVWWLFGKPILFFLGGAMVLFGLLLQLGRYLRRDRRQEERHGRRTKGPELTSIASWGRRKEAGGIRFRLQADGAAAKALLPWGPTFRIPKRLESSHILLMGDTGAGKSSAIRQLLREVEKRGESAVVYDPAREFIGEFYSPERGDLVLNPLDARCPYWSLGEEINRPETACPKAATVWSPAEAGAGDAASEETCCACP